MKIITGNANPKLAQQIAEHCFATLVPATVTTFDDGESSVEFNENIRGEDVFIVQSTCTPVNDSLMELLIMIDAARRSSASRITAVIPYFGYARQDRKSASRTPITAKLVANLNCYRRTLPNTTPWYPTPSSKGKGNERNQCSFIRI